MQKFPPSSFLEFRLSGTSSRRLNCQQASVQRAYNAMHLGFHLMPASLTLGDANPEGRLASHISAIPLNMRSLPATHK